MSVVTTLKRYRGGAAYSIANVYDDRLAFITECTKYLLHFEDSTTKDECGNSWTAYGSPALNSDTKKIGTSSLYLDGSSYLETTSVKLGGQDFTIDFWGYMSSTTRNWSRFLVLFDIIDCATKRINIGRFHGETKLYVAINNNIEITDTPFTFFNTWNHYALVYQHAANKFLVFVNGRLINTTTITFDDYIYNYCWLGKSEFLVDGNSTCYIDELRISNGIARWTANFTPPSEPYTSGELSIDKNILIRHNGANCYIPMTSDVTKTKTPCLALRHDNTNFYAIK